MITIGTASYLNKSFERTRKGTNKKGKANITKVKKLIIYGTGVKPVIIG